MAATSFAVVPSGRRLVLVAGALLTLAACEIPSFGAPEPASKEGRHVLSLWQGFFIASLAVGALVLGLITYALIRFRRRDDRIPSQKPYNVTWEIIYTVTPIIAVAVLFGFSISTQNKVDRLVDRPDVIVDVTGYQWGWQFAYRDLGVTVNGTGEQQLPELVLPVNKTVRFVLRTNDVNHSFWVPAFLEKRDLIAGIDNQIDITPDRTGTFDGRCAEYCGLDHWRMGFTVTVMDQPGFDSWARTHGGATP
ncbi:MAG: cytochrome c oxidase subunit [Acidimicrobiaceae bacterium]